MGPPRAAPLRAPLAASRCEPACRSSVTPRPAGHCRPPTRTSRRHRYGRPRGRSQAGGSKEERCRPARCRRPRSSGRAQWPSNGGGARPRAHPRIAASRPGTRQLPGCGLREPRRGGASRCRRPAGARRRSSVPGRPVGHEAPRSKLSGRSPPGRCGVCSSVDPSGLSCCSQTKTPLGSSRGDGGCCAVRQARSALMDTICPAWQRRNTSS